MSNTRHDLDQSDWHFGPISGPVCGALGAVAVALLHPFVGFPVWLPVAVAAFSSGIAVLAGALRGTAYLTTAYRAACWLLAGGWTLWPMLAGWSWMPFGVLLVVGITVGVLAPILGPERERDPNAVGLMATLALAGGPSLKDEWAERITRQARIDGGAIVRDVDHWPNGTGYTLTGGFPPESGYQWTAIRDVAGNIAAAKELPVGCPVVAEIGTHQGGWRLHVATSIDGLLSDIPFPDDMSPRSIQDDFPIGQLLDTRPVTLNCFQSATVIIGERGGGKTVLLHNITGNVALTNDCILLLADLNGGGQAAPWVSAWANGQVDKCRIGAVALTDQQALDMAEALLRIAKDRKSRYQSLMIKHDTDVLPPGIVPEFLVIVDEGGEVYGAEATRIAQKAAEKFREVQRIGRAMLVNVVLTSQRGTSDYIPSQVKANARNKIALTVQNDSELAYLYDWHQGLKSVDLVTSGCAYIRTSVRDSPRQFKAFLLTPKTIQRIAMATADRTPEPDAPAVRLGGTWWAERWTNPVTAAWLAKLRGEDVDGPDDQDDDAQEASTADDPFGLGMPVDALIKDAKQRVSAAGQSQPQPMSSAARAATPAPADDLPEWAREELARLDAAPVATMDGPGAPVHDLLSPGEALARLVEAGAVEVDQQEADTLGNALAQQRAADVEQQAHDLVASLSDGQKFVLTFIAQRIGKETRTGDVIAAVEEAGYGVTRQTISEWLGTLKAAEVIHQPGGRQGRWAIGNGQAAA